jgi:hypothetical protein
MTSLGAELLRRYMASVHFEGTPGTQSNELVHLRELCRLVETIEFTSLSVQALTAIADAPAPSITAAKRRRLVVGRLLRLLRQEGELPSAAEVTASRSIEADLLATPPGGRGTLRRWLAVRKRKLGWHELRWEARRLRELEAVIGDYPGADDEELTTRWLLRLVRQIVDCGCPPVTRRTDPAVCVCCGATTASHGSRPSPGEANQRKLSAVACNYLKFRRQPTPTAVIF